MQVELYIYIHMCVCYIVLYIYIIYIQLSIFRSVWLYRILMRSPNPTRF